MTKIILAIDPGKSGGFAFKHSDNVHVVTGNLPEDDGGIMEWMRDLGGQAELVELHIEKVGSHAGDLGMAASMAKLYGGKRFIEGFALGLGWRVVNVPAKTWQAFFSFGKKNKVKKIRKGKEIEAVDDVEWKNRLKAEAMKRFSGVKVTLNNADALLILEHALSNPALL